MTDSQNWNPDRADAMERKRKRKYLIIRSLKILKPILDIAFVLCIAIMLVFIAPYVSGKEVFDDPMTESQLQAMIFMLFLVVLLRWKR